MPFFKGTGGLKLMKHVETSVNCEFASLQGAVFYTSIPLTMNTLYSSG
jgi:hypothetical protein